MAKPKMRPPTHEEFVFHVRAPSLSYSFGLQHDRRLREVEPFDEQATVHFVTECIWPDRFKGREGKATIYPEGGISMPLRRAIDEQPSGPPGGALHRFGLSGLASVSPPRCPL